MDQLLFLAKSHPSGLLSSTSTMAKVKEDLDAEPVHVEQTVGVQQTHDDVFGEISDDGPNFRNVNISWLFDTMDG